MVTVAEHTYEETLLPEKANVADLGCRGFLFSDELHRLGHNVFAVDCDHLPDGFFKPYGYYKCAITDENGLCMLKYSDDPQATTVIKAKVPLAGFDVPMYTLKSFSEMVGVQFFDLIKMDVEGFEREIIMSLTDAPSKMISVEFHTHTGAYGFHEVNLMEEKLHSLGYTTVKHELTSAHGMGRNYWDSLFIIL